MSNPYDPNQGQQPPYDPYGTPGQGNQGGGGPYGGNEYGGGQYGGGQYGGGQYGGGQYGGGNQGGQFGGSGPYGGQPEPKGTDAVSITGFVLSLTCCLSVVGAILGFVGLKRTKDGERKGRWAAIAAIPIGLVGTIALVVFIIAIVFVAKNQITPDNATVGQCANTDTESGQVSLTKKECSESHDAQIVYVGKAGDDADTLEGSNATQTCLDRAPEISGLISDYDLSAVIEDPDDVDADDRFVCYIEASDGSKLTEKINP